MNRRDQTKLGIAVVCLAAAAGVWWYSRGADPSKPGRFFYDLSEKKLYAVSRDAFAPEAGLAGESGDGVEAVIVYCPQCGADARRIAYLRTHTPEFKQRDAEARKTGRPIDDLTREYIEANTLVRDVDGATWFKTSSKEGSKVVRGWRRNCPTHGEPEVPLRPGDRE